MFNDDLLSEPETILEIESPVKLSFIDEQDGIYFNDKYTSERRIRTYVYNLLKQAQAYLPSSYHFMIYEAYRPKAAQIVLWEGVVAQKKQEFPHLDITSEDFIKLCNVYAANPYRQGSGHQSGAALDVTLVNDLGVEYDMGGQVRGFGAEAEFAAPNISATAHQNRAILQTTLAKVGLINYPSEWWHYSFGDRLWARLTGSKLAIFANIEKE